MLGGGGASGLAFHAGVLWALQHDLGWDARTADIVVGTSAGSIVGALLRTDVAPEDLAAWATDADPSTEGHLFRAVMAAADSTITRRTVPRITMPVLHMLNALRHPSQIPGAMATMLPHGFQDHSPHVTSLIRLETWPSKPLWVSAVRLGDGHLEWFGRDHDVGGTTVKLADAVAASCAIPVLARPVRIGSHRYLDGSVKSPTHADALLDADLDLVIVLSPMGHIAGRNPLRVAAHRRVRREAALLERAGVAVQLISPNRDTMNIMGLNMLDRARTGSVMLHSFLGAVAQLDESAAAAIRAAGAANAAPRPRPGRPVPTRIRSSVGQQAAARAAAVSGVRSAGARRTPAGFADR